ncbi:MAG: fibronectin type III domain-containing protein [Ignavibacteriae bacterium]|nr:fibronectin type III domain-containing protein [Ignavibacteriota bacterium]
MELKYLRVAYERREKQKKGIEANQDKWNGQPDTLESLQADMDALQAKDSQAAEYKRLYRQTVQEGRELAAQINAKADETDNRIRGIHAAEKVKWTEYGLQWERPRVSLEKPAKPLLLTIRDDSDGIGFKIRLVEADDNAELYKWERGVSENPKAIAPDKWEYLTESTTIAIIDDDVTPGVRYFYRVQAVNNKGKGTVSPAVSRVQ